VVRQHLFFLARGRLPFVSDSNRLRHDTYRLPLGRTVCWTLILAGGSMRIANLIGCALLAACAPSDLPTEPAADHHEELVLETIPYPALGGMRVTFNRDDHSKRGVISVDGAAQTGAITNSVFGTLVARSPATGKLAYAGFTPASNNDRSIDIYIRDWDAATGVALGGPGRGRDTPSWNTAGTRIIYGESTIDAIGLTKDRIVSQLPIPGAADRQVLWQASGHCEFAWEPSQSVTTKLVFLYSFAPPPNGIDCGTSPRIARATPGGPAELLYGSAGMNLYSPIWSPSGAEIAFFEIVSFNQTGFANVALQRMAADGSNVRTIATVKHYGGTAEVNFSMCWSGDGSRIIFSIFDSPEASHVFAVTVANGNVTQITSAPGVLDWSVSCG
jgi:hypothetical protein